MGFAKSALAQERLVIPENDFMPSISIHAAAFGRFSFVTLLAKATRAPIPKGIAEPQIILRVIANYFLERIY
jgi:hypothetical protein